MAIGSLGGNFSFGENKFVQKPEIKDEFSYNAFSKGPLATQGTGMKNPDAMESGKQSLLDLWG